MGQCYIISYQLVAFLFVCFYCRSRSLDSALKNDFADVMTVKEPEQPVKEESSTMYLWSFHANFILGCCVSNLGYFLQSVSRH